MEDHQTAPLLQHCNNSGAAAAKKVVSTVDDVIERCIGGTGLAQLLQAFLVDFAWFFDAQQTFVAVFTDAQPSWHCTGATDEQCSMASQPCGLPSGSWEWDRPRVASIVSEWDLECSTAAVAGLPSSAFFIGCLAGGFLLATLADSWLGRKKMLIISCITMSLTSAFTIASSNIWVYAALRFISGFARATVGTSSLVLSTELVGKRWRDRVSIVGSLCFTLGFLSLTFIAFLNRGSSWRNIYLWISIPCMFYSILVYFLIPESPRWLLIRGRRDDAIDTLKSIASLNGDAITCSFSNLPAVEETCNGGGGADMFSAVRILCGKRWALKRLVAVMTAAFGIGLVYYGMPLALGNLGFNLYLSVAFNALSEVPSSLLALCLIDRLNRRSSTAAFAAVSGVCSVICVLVESEGMQMAMEVFSFFNTCTAISVLYIYCIELFPTCVRNSAISMVRQAMVFGGVWAPMLVVAGRKKVFLSFGVFGIVIGCCGLAVCFLPETRGRGICDTMEEEDNKLKATRPSLA